MTIDVQALFEEELAQRGFGFKQEDALTYRVRSARGDVLVSLANLRRDVERDKKPNAVGQFVETVLETLSVERPGWDGASKLLFWAAEAADLGRTDCISEDLTRETCRVLTLTDESRSLVTWVTSSMCDDWGVRIDEAKAVASRNQDTLLAGLSLETAEAAGERLGMVPVDSAYKASVIFAPSFRQFVEPHLGWPVLVVLPCRDFIYIVSDSSPLVGKLGAVVVREFLSSGYPISTEVLRISDNGIEALGKFPVPT
jgi:hypothetical protein